MRIVECQESSPVLGKLLYDHSGLWVHLLFLAWQFAFFNKNATKWINKVSLETLEQSH